MDSLDEYKDKTNILEKITKYKNEYENMKFIITTRPELDYPKFLAIESNTFVKLERFTENQIEKFIIKYGVSLEYDNLIKYIEYDALSTPLFCYMTISTISKNIEFLLQISKKEGNKKITKTILYLYFIHSILQGRLKETVSQDDISKSYRYEKSLLRKVAALKQLTTIFKLQDIEYNLPKLGMEYKKEIIEPIFSTYFLPEGDELRERIEFLHRSFEEYLIAEYYIESILQNKPHLLNLGTSDVVVSEVTLNFLNNLLNIIASSNKSEVYNLFFKSLLHDNVIDKDKTINQFIIEQLIKNAQSILETENIIGLNHINKKENEEGFWFIKKLEKQDYSYIWNHRWISLFTLVHAYQFPTDNSKINLNKDIANFIKVSSSLVSYKLRNFKRCSLIESDFSRAYLSRANFSFADSSSSDLFRAYLSL